MGVIIPPDVGKWGMTGIWSQPDLAQVLALHQPAMVMMDHFLLWASVFPPV